MDYRKDAHLSGTTEKGIMCPAIRNYRKENTVPTYKELQEREHCAQLLGTTGKRTLCPAIRNYRKENTVSTYSIRNYRTGAHL